MSYVLRRSVIVIAPFSLLSVVIVLFPVSHVQDSTAWLVFILLQTSITPDPNCYDCW